MNVSKKASGAFCKKLMSVLSFVLLLVTIGSGGAQASQIESTGVSEVQQSGKKIEGLIKDNKGEPLIGVSVVVKGTTVGTVTDVDGRYTLTAADGAQLVFSYVGYIPQTIAATKNVINVVMVEDAVQMGDVVIVGFGVQKKEHLTGPISSVDVEKALGSKPVFDITKSLQGVTPGLSIAYNSGSINASPVVNIRGIGTIIDGKAGGEPLVLVDGVPTKLNMVNPDDIASISVLKDASSAAIYGTRGAFGVVLIITKSGKPTGDRVKFNYSNNFGFNKPTVVTDFSDPLDELPIMYAGAKSAGTLNPEVFGMNLQTLIKGITTWKEKYADNRTSKEMVLGEDWEIINGVPHFYRVWDPNKEMLNNSSFQQTHNFSAQGSLGEKSTFLASLAYADQNGLLKIKQDNLKRYNVNLNLTTQLASWLKASMGAMFTRRDIKEPFNYYDNSGIDRASAAESNGVGSNGYFGYYMRWGKYFPYGTYGGHYFRHAPGYMDAANMNKTQNDYLKLNAALTADITKDLQFVTEYSFSTNSTDLQINGHPVSLLNFWAGGFNASDVVGSGLAQVAAVGSASDKVALMNNKKQIHVFNAYGTYSKKVGEGHSFRATVGTNIEKGYFKQIYSERRNVMDESLSNIQLATGSQFATSTYKYLKPAENDYAIAGFFGRLNYDYQGKYLLELVGRYDGSSKFPKHELWGFFPSVSGGYRISEEPFMQGTKEIINDAKVRLSYGQIGNQNVRDNAFRPMMDIYTVNWITNGTLTPSVYNPGIVDPDLSWERVESTNFGLDMQFFNNMFGLTVDVYQRYNKDMLTKATTIPDNTGTDAPLTNAGDIRTRGYEIQLNFNHNINQNASVYATLSLSDYKTVISKWNNPTKSLGDFYEGMTFGEIWGFETDRLFQTSDFTVDGSGKYIMNADLPSQTLLEKGNFKFQPGDVKYANLDGDNAITAGKLTADEHGDLKVIGNTTPRYQYGIRVGGNFYGFDADIFLQGVGKRDYWAGSDLVLPLYNRSDAVYGNQLDYWTEDNTDAFFPRPYTGHATNAFGSRLLYSSNYTGSNNFITQSRYLLSMSYLRLKNVTVGYTLPSQLTKKAGIDKVRIYFSGQNLAEIKNSRLPVDPEINETEAQWGRTYPYSRTYSMGLQVNF